MKAALLLDAAKERLSLKSDYALAKAAEVPKQRISNVRKGIERIPLHLAYWLAITLQLDPAQVVAELEADWEKNEKRAAFWRSFLSRAALLAGVACTLVLLSFAGSGNAQAANGGGTLRANNPYYVKY